ncbi:MAG: hypothetical protein ACYCOY_12200, partial [Metallibacterium sp.]
MIELSGKTCTAEVGAVVLFLLPRNMAPRAWIAPELIEVQTPASNREDSHPPLIAAIQPHRRTSLLRTSNLAERGDCSAHPAPHPARQRAGLPAASAGVPDACVEPRGFSPSLDRCDPTASQDKPFTHIKLGGEGGIARRILRLTPRASARGCLRHPQAFQTPASNREDSHPPLIAAIQPHRRTSLLRTSNLAEREGFEPSVGVNPRQFSRLLP